MALRPRPSAVSRRAPRPTLDRMRHIGLLSIDLRRFFACFCPLSAFTALAFDSASLAFALSSFAFARSSLV